MTYTCENCLRTISTTTGSRNIAQRSEALAATAETDRTSTVTDTKCEYCGHVLATKSV